MVRFRKTHLYLVWCILILSLFFVNWVGLRDRYVTHSFSTNDVTQIALGDIDVYKPGLEMAYLTPSSVYIIGGLSSTPWQNSTYQNVDWEINPLIALTVGDFDINHKGDEIAVLMENGLLKMIYRGLAIWHTVDIGMLPDEPPVWTTNQMFAGQLIASSEANEIAIVGQYYNWTTTTSSGRIYVANRVNDTIWEINQIHEEPTPLLSGTVGDVDTGNSGEELIAGGVDNCIFYLGYDNGSWTETRFHPWLGLSKSISVGDFMVSHSGNEIAVVRDQDIFVFYKQSGNWTSSTSWVARFMDVGIESVYIGDIDPFSPGQEILGAGTSLNDNQPTLVVLRYTSLWVPTILSTLAEPPTSIAVTNFDFSRMGTEILIVYSPQIAVLSIPNGLDRIFRAGQTVLLPAILLLPATILLFAAADYLGRVAEARRRNRTLEMVSKGYVKCPICKRFIPKDKAEAHRRWHQTMQFR
ncbi:MAG: hypothetical protein ACFFCF_08065 [Promethearchaeota archaeon]